MDPVLVGTMQQIYEFFEAATSSTVRPTVTLKDGKEVRFPPLDLSVESFLFNIGLPLLAMALGCIVYVGTKKFFDYLWSWFF
jgi:hypothetical protein